jgi:hypothetical protein
MRDPRTGASIQRTSGQYAGYYISESSLHDVWHKTMRGPQLDPDYQINANVYPYIALPQKLLRNTGLKVGDYALAIHGTTGAYTFAVYADAKNVPVMAESSSALARALGLRYDRHGGIGSGIIYVVFPDTRLGLNLPCALSDLRINGLRWLQLYDARLDLGVKISSCFAPEFPGVAKALRSLL